MMDFVSVNAWSPRLRRVSGRIGFYSLLLVMLMGFLAPFAYMMLMSIMPADQVVSASNSGRFSPTLDNFRFVTSEAGFGRYGLNSLVVAVATVIGSLTLGVPAAFAIAVRKKLRLGYLMLVARTAPGIAFLIPWFVMFRRLELLDTHLLLASTHMVIGLPLVVWLMLSFFEDLPTETLDAARVDGASYTSVLLRIAVPMVKAGIATAAIITFVFSWNHFMFALVLTGREAATAPVGILQFLTWGQVNWGALTAAAVVMTAPVLLLAVLAQKHIVRGLTSGSTKY
jgi:multiple sugar transport system permease protein